MKKVTIFCYDYWSYGKRIVKKAEQKGVDVIFINALEYKFSYSSFFQRVKNAFNKAFFNKNIKKTYVRNVVLQKIMNLPKQDLILVINPYYFDVEQISEMRKKCDRLVSYSFDSLERLPFALEKRTFFDKMYTFDYQNAQENKEFIHLPNFNYLEKSDNLSTIKNKAFIILSECSYRLELLKKIADFLLEKKIHNFEFIVYSNEKKAFHPNITTICTPLSLEQIEEKMKTSEILIDLVREQQSGLSFRVFEAMAMQKKLVTNNKNVKKYDFYNPNNILVIENDFSEISSDFLESQYQPIPEEIYQKYTLNHWVDEVFELKN